MFFVQKVADWRQREFFLIHWLPTLIIFITFMGVTVWSWQAAKDRAEQDRREELIARTEETENRIFQRASIYQEILRAGAVLFQSSQDVTREEWQTFAELFEIKERYPSVRGINFIDVIPKSELQTHVATIRSEPGQKDYRIFPQSDRELYTSLLYVEPDGDSSTQEDIGFDPYTSQAKKEAMIDAIRTGNPAFTDIVYSPNDRGQTQPSIGIYYPIFLDSTQSGESLKDVDGLVQVLVRDSSLFEGIITEDTGGTFAERIYIENANESQLYKSANYDAVAGSEESMSVRSRLNLNNVNWIVETASSQGSGTPEIQDRPNNILIGGTLISLVIASFVYYLLLTRTRSIALKEDIEIQSAKDELLALASHQLRTPATGVKQYIGMLREGYAGHMSDKQMDLLKRANDSNERQLTTINEMLSVARADAGRLRVEPTDTNINKLIKEVVEEQRHVAEERHQRVTLSLPKETIHCSVDPRYFRMAVENITNNASKYTPEKGAIDIKLEKIKNDLRISVHDTGVGIPSRHYSLLFKKFSRIPNDLSSRVSGSGIGLYLAKHIVEAHGGQLTFSSDPGVGSTFRIVLSCRKKRKVQ
jgi:signal transduction histidine kinase/type II secretory pathway pseudopilin PulG